jgi:hypothetical protein
VIVTVPLSTLLTSLTSPGGHGGPGGPGGDGEPGVLAGYGPIPPQMARDIAERGVWGCAVVDDTHGTLLGLGRSTFTPQYRPGPRLRRFAQTRDQRCGAPGCNARADRADLDHRDRHPHGATCECNMQALCRGHHRRKHDGTLRVRASTDQHDPPGTLIWTTRAGLSCKRPPTSLTGPDPPRPLAASQRPQPLDHRPTPARLLTWAAP